MVTYKEAGVCIALKKNLTLRKETDPYSKWYSYLLFKL